MRNAPKLLTALAFGVATTFAFAQTPTEQPMKSGHDSMPAKTDQIKSQGNETGNNMSAEKDAMKSGDSAPEKTEHIKSQGMESGNNLMGATDATAFEKLDVKKTGKVTMKEAKNDPWLAKNFKKCDQDNNGTVSREEYAACKSKM